MVAAPMCLFVINCVKVGMCQLYSLTFPPLVFLGSNYIFSPWCKIALTIPHEYSSDARTLGLYCTPQDLVGRWPLLDSAQLSKNGDFPDLHTWTVHQVCTSRMTTPLLTPCLPLVTARTHTTQLLSAQSVGSQGLFKWVS